MIAYYLDSLTRYYSQFGRLPFVGVRDLARDHAAIAQIDPYSRDYSLDRV